MDERSLLSAVHTYKRFPSPHFHISALPESLAVLFVLFKCPYSTETVIGVFKENRPHFDPTTNELLLPFCWRPGVTSRRWSLQHTGELFQTHFWCGSLPWKPEWSSNLNSLGAVLDLFNFCIVLYVRCRYFLEFTFAILDFLLLAKRMRDLLETGGQKQVPDIQCFEEISLQLDSIRIVLMCLHLLQ